MKRTSVCQAFIVSALLWSIQLSEAAIPITTFGTGWQYPYPDVGAAMTFDLNGLSDDGTTVFGKVTGGSSAGSGFWWTKPDGLHFLPGIPKYTSYDGTVLAGDRFYWSKSATAKTLPFTITALSSDGSTLIGKDSSGGLRWTSDGSVQRLNFNPQAVSANGKVVAGDGGPRSSNGHRDVILWTKDEGEKNLGNLALEGPPSCAPYCPPPYPTPVTERVYVSRDGRIVTGHQSNSDPTGNPADDLFVSIDGSKIRHVAWESVSNGISSDGSVIYGRDYHDAARWTISPSGEVVGGRILSGGQFTDSSFDGSILLIACCDVDRPLYWDAELGAMRLSEALRIKGVAIDDGEVGGNRAFISDSGRVFASNALPFGDTDIGPSFWLVNLGVVPEPAPFVWMGVASLGLVLTARYKGRRRACSTLA
jgi:hypothetical protein